MNPSRSNTDAGASSKDAETTRLMNSGEQDGPSRDSSFQSSAPSAPLLETIEPEPPSYDSVMAQDASDSKNRFSSSSIGSLHQDRNQAPYPIGPGSAPQTPYPPKAGYSPSETPAQTCPTGTGYSPQAAGNPPYPGGPGLGSPVTSQPPYSTGSGYTPGPGSQAPYPTGPMPMPGPVETGTQIGFVAPVTIVPKPSNTGFQNLGYRQRTSYYTSGEKDQYVHTTQQHATNQNPQQQQLPTVIHVVQKNETTTSIDDDCCFWFCCSIFCQCLIECIGNMLTPETRKKVVIVIAIFMATFVAVVLFGIITILVSFSR